MLSQLAQNASNPLVVPVAGKIAIRKDKLVITPSDQPTVRYEIPGFKQMMVKDGEEIVAGQRLTNGSINLHELMKLQGVESNSTLHHERNP
jgi:DNA-directed RNA polymerase subunit beta'